MWRRPRRCALKAMSSVRAMGLEGFKAPLAVRHFVCHSLHMVESAFSEVWAHVDTCKFIGCTACETASCNCLLCDQYQMNVWHLLGRETARMKHRESWYDISNFTFSCFSAERHRSLHTYSNRPHAAHVCYSSSMMLSKSAQSAILSLQGPQLMAVCMWTAVPSLWCPTQWAFLGGASPTSPPGAGLQMTM